jgi:hypothetical protein
MITGTAKSEGNAEKISFNAFNPPDETPITMAS